MATYLEICKAVRAQASISGDGPNNVTGQTGIYADVVRWVDESYNEIQTLHESWNFLYTLNSFTLAADLETYPAIANDGVRQIAKDSYLRQFQSEDKDKLHYLSWYKYKNSFHYLKTDTGIPTTVSEDPSGVLHFFPIPEEDYTIYYEGFNRPDVMENSTDTPIFAAQYHDLIKLLALMKYGEYYNSQEVYKSAQANYRLLLSKMEFSELPRDNIVTPPLVKFA